MKKFLFLIIILNILLNLNAINEISLKGGVLFTADRDIVLSPILTNTFTPIGELSYTVGNKDSYHNINTFFSMGEIQSPISGIPLDFGKYGKHTRGDLLILGDLDYTYYHKGAEVNGMIFYFGIGIEFDFQMTLAHYPVVNSATEVNIGMSFNKQIGKHRIGGSFLIPVLTYLNRPPYTATDDEIMDMASNDLMGLITRGEVTSLFDYFNIDLGLNYKYSLSENLKLDSGFRLGYKYVDIPREKWMLENSLMVGLAYDFDGENR